MNGNVLPIWDEAEILHREAGTVLHDLKNARNFRLGSEAYNRIKMGHFVFGVFSAGDEERDQPIFDATQSMGTSSANPYISLVRSRPLMLDDRYLR